MKKVSPSLLLGLVFFYIKGCVGVFEETAKAVKVELNEHEIKGYFMQSDKNADGTLDASELQNWVKLMVDAHVKDNIPKSQSEFRSVDFNRDRIVTWDEYRVVMKSLHHGAEEHHVYTEQEQSHKFRQADENGDGVLNQIEYVAFKNPMTTSYVLHRIAHELLEDFDEDKDSKVSLAEFVHHTASRVEDKNDDEITELREQEFENVIDTNKDNFLDQEEFKDYLDPRGINFAKNEANLMMNQADSNKDSKLTLEEITENFLHFQKHKQNPVVRALHDEF